MHKFEENDKICRVIYSPEDMDINNVFEKSSVKRNDLQKNGFSVDLKKLIDVNELCQRVARQQSKLPDERRDAYIGTFLYQMLMEIVDDDHDDVMFEIIYNPVHDKDTGELINPAHCLIFCTKKDEQRPHYNEARLKINALMNNLQKMDIFINKCFPQGV